MESRRIANRSLNKNIKKKRNGKILLIVTLLLTVIIYYQVVILFKYTLGRPVESKKLALYNYVTEKIYGKEK